MLHLLRTEWLKIRNYPGFWWIMLVTVLSFPGINGLVYFIYKDQTQNEKVAAQMLKMLIGNPFEFPEVFRTVAFTSSLFVVIPAILIIMLITNEYTYKTNRQNIIDGWSRNQFILAKFLNVVVVSFIVIALYIVVTFVIGFVTTGTDVSNRFELIHYILYYSLQVFEQLSFAFLLGLVIKRAFIALGTFIFYKVIVENIASGFMIKYAKDAGRFLPTESSDRLTPIPAFLGKLDPQEYEKTLSLLNQQALLAAAYVIIFWALVLWIYRKRDL
jgi:ABC-2 type transport system permease protein